MYSEFCHRNIQIICSASFMTMIFFTSGVAITCGGIHCTVSIVRWKVRFKCCVYEIGGIWAVIECAFHCNKVFLSTFKLTTINYNTLFESTWSKRNIQITKKITLLLYIQTRAVIFFKPCIILLLQLNWLLISLHENRFANYL